MLNNKRKAYAIWSHESLIAGRCTGDEKDVFSNHWRYYHIEHVGNIADVSPMCLRHFKPWCTLSNVCRLLCGARRLCDISPMVLGEISIHALTFFSMSQCLSDYAITRVCDPFTGTWWRFSGNSLTCALRKHREA